MRKIIYLFVYLELILLTSCQDWFDVSPKSEVKAEDLFQKESGFREMGSCHLSFQVCVYNSSISFIFL